MLVAIEFPILKEILLLKYALMKNLLLLICFCSTLPLLSQPTLLNFGEGQFHHITPSHDGHFYLLGSLEGKIVLKKINAGAEEIWSKI